MAVLDLAHLTWEEVRDLDRTKTVAIVPVGAVEAHGPHLPLATDVIIAEAMARAAAGRLAARGHEAVLLPAIAYTAAEFAAGFPGTVSLQPATVTALLVDLARSLARHGLSLLAVANAHLDPAHLGAIEAAVTQIRRADRARIVFPDVTKKPWAVRLTEEFRSGACHAGQYESSIVLAARPELVRETVRRSLPANPRSLSGAIRAGQTNFEQAGGPRGGGPARPRGYPGEQCRDQPLGVAAEDHAGGLATDPDGERYRPVPVHPGLPPGNARARLGARGEHRIRRGARRRQVHRRVQRIEARGDRLHTLGCRRGRGDGRDRQCGVRRIRGHGHDAAVGQPHRGEDRDVARGRPACSPRHHRPAPADSAGRSGERGAGAVPRRRE